LLFFTGPMPGIVGNMRSEGPSFSWLAESMPSNRSWEVRGRFRWKQLTLKVFWELSKSVQHASRPFHTICTGRRDRAILAGLGGSDGIRHLAVLFVSTSRNSPQLTP
jgi:hypothetical protein